VITVIIPALLFPAELASHSGKVAAAEIDAIAFSRTGNLATGDFGDAISVFGLSGKDHHKRLRFRRRKPILARDPGPVR
jgi:hypothetical protein